MTNATRYPLSWPIGWPRKSPAQRSRAKFKKGTRQYYSNSPGSWLQNSALTVPQGLARLGVELERLGARAVLVSTNVELNSHGDPRGGRREPDDPGAAVYFKLGGKDRVLACDRWDRTADNLAAIAAHIECVRGIDRYGVGTLDQAFAGYDALPPPIVTPAKRTWRQVFGIPEDMPATSSAIKEFYRDLATRRHPDVPGGSHEAMAQLNAARDEALKEIGP